MFLIFLVVLVLIVLIAVVLLRRFMGSSNTVIGSVSEEGKSKVINGAATLNDAKYDSLTVNGALKANDVFIERLVVNGAAYLNDCVVELANINGALQANDTVFHDTVTVTGAVRFTDCQAHDIVVKEVEMFGGEVVLRGDAIVEGTITFESGNGKVIVQDDAQVFGEVIGGEIIRK